MNKYETNDHLGAIYRKVVDQLSQAIASPQNAPEALLEAHRAVAIEQTRARIYDQPTKDLDRLVETITTLKAKIL